MKSWFFGKKVKKYTIPSNVTSIGDSAFSGCSSLQSINIPSSVTSIGNNAFYQCSSLQSINIPENVTSIGNSAFSGCSSLYKAKINSSAKIGSYSYRFRGAYLTVFYDFSLLSASNGIQEEEDISVIIVPDALYDEWIAATNWVAYASKIKKESEIENTEVAG